jgi:hypothetical protein
VDTLNVFRDVVVPKVPAERIFSRGTTSFAGTPIHPVMFVAHSNTLLRVDALSPSEIAYSLNYDLTSGYRCHECFRRPAGLLFSRCQKG